MVIVDKRVNFRTIFCLYNEGRAFPSSLWSLWKRVFGPIWWSDLLVSEAVHGPSPCPSGGGRSGELAAEESGERGLFGA